jgi:hypothetical protein
MILSRMSIDLSKMAKNAAMLAKALGDPRLAAYVDDPAVQAERAAMQQLYDAEMSRLNALTEFVGRDQLATLGHDDGDPAGFGRSKRVPAPATRAAPDPTPTPTSLPQLTGIDLKDTKVMQDWTNTINVTMRASENVAAHVLLDVFTGCH